MTTGRTVEESVDPALVERYLDAFEFVVASRFGYEIVGLEMFRIDDVDEGIFLREFAFVVLVSGFRYSTVQGLFPRINDAFLGFQDAKRIVSVMDHAYADALDVFNHHRKLSTICQAIREIADQGFGAYWSDLMADWDSIERYDLIGEVTGLHLARILGMDVAKPDRHLMRLAAALDTSVVDLTAGIGRATGDRVAVVDGVIWRFATMCPESIRFFVEGGRICDDASVLPISTLEGDPRSGRPGLRSDAGAVEVMV